MSARIASAFTVVAVVGLAHCGSSDGGPEAVAGSVGGADASAGSGGAGGAPGIGGGAGRSGGDASVRADVTVPVEAGPFKPNPTLTPIADNTVLDLDKYTCSAVSGEDTSDCRKMTDYSGFVYDAGNHQMLAFGGGHATTMNDSVVALPLDGALAWKSLYEPTPCSSMTPANLDSALGAWKAGPSGPYPRPLSAHTYDFLGVAVAQNEFILLGRSFTGGSCSGVGNDEKGPIAHFSLTAQAWTFSADTTTVSFSGNMSGTEFDPVGGFFVSLGQTGLSTYDPVARTMRHVADTLPSAGGTAVDMGALSYANHLVYFPPQDTFYFFARGTPVGTYALKLDRAKLDQSTLDTVTTQGPTSPHQEPGYDYDSHNAIIGGGVNAGTFYAFDPATKTWTSSVVAGGTPGTQAFHALGYDPVNNVFVFVTDYASGQHTWAYRYKG
jgi:hypothetical protein